MGRYADTFSRLDQNVGTRQSSSLYTLPSGNLIPGTLIDAYDVAGRFAVARILVIDDSRLSRMRMNDALTEAGHVIVEAENGVRRLAAHAEHQPDCIVLDLLMPEMDGHEFLRQLRNGGSETPVIVSTAEQQLHLAS